MSDSSAINFGASVDVLSNALTGAGMEHKAIANNIANVNTPNYRRQDVSFRDALAATLGTPADPDQLGMVTSDDRHFAIGDAQTPAAFDPQTQVDENTQMRNDKSNVDVDQEMAELSSNSGYSQTMSQLLQVQFMRLREAITEQTR